MDLYKELPSLEFKLSIDLRGSRTNVAYKGEFICKIPDVNDLAEMDKRRALMSLGLDENLEDTTRLYYEKMSYLQCIILIQPDIPKWWAQSNNGRTLLDANVIAAMYDKAVEKEEEWKKAVWGDAPKELSEVASDEKAE